MALRTVSTESVLTEAENSSGEFWLLRVRTPLYEAFYAYKASAEFRRLHVSGESRS